DGDGPSEDRRSAPHLCKPDLSGVTASYPKLRFVIVEGGIGWIAAVTRLMDHWWEDHHHWLEPRLEEPPSFYARRHFYHTFEDDKAGLMHLPMLNADGLMWGSDYPHRRNVPPFQGSRSPRTSPICRRTSSARWCATTPRDCTAFSSYRLGSTTIAW